MEKGLWIIVILILVVVGGFFIFSGDDDNVDLDDSLDNAQKVPAPGADGEGIDETIVNGNGAEEHTVEMSSSGFSPSTLTINVGETVVFNAIDDSNRWPASDNHPTHTIYPGSSRSKCGTTEEKEMFDACGTISEGESFTFTFNEIGTWKYHDHRDSGKTGMIIVN
jgi:plastocyanin